MMNSTEKSKIQGRQHVSGCRGSKLRRRIPYLLLAPGRMTEPRVPFPAPLGQGPVALLSFLLEGL